MAYTAPPTDDFNPLLPDDDLGTLPMDEVIREAINARLLGLFVCQPGSINAITAEQTVDVKLLFQTRDLNATAAADQPILQRVPVAMPMGQGYSIRLPLAVGDLGLVLFADRSLDSYLASGGAQTVDPADARLHSINDAVFLPGFPTTSQNTADGTTDLVLSAGQGQIRVLANGKVQLKNQTQEALNLVDQLITAVSNIVTAFSSAAAAITIGAPSGPLPLNPAVVSALSTASSTIAAVQANLATLKV